jgi:hypothetical protein
MDVHISVIEDFKSIAPSWVKVTDWSLSGHHWVFQKPKATPLHIDSTTWKDLTPEMIVSFRTEYDAFLRSFDGFIVGYASCFAMIYEPYGKPIIMMNAVRYDVPFCWSKDRAMLDEHTATLHRLQSAGLLTIVSNNRADQLYLETATGLSSHYIPSICLYTRIKYAPTRSTFLCYHVDVPPHPLVTPKYSTGAFTWSDLGGYRGIIHFPYEVSTMSMFEHFSGGLPLFFPSKSFWKSNGHGLTSIQSYWGDALPDSLQALKSPDTWIDLSDVYLTFRSPNTHYYDSFDHLVQLLETFQYVDDRADRQAYIDSARSEWARLLRPIRPELQLESSFWLGK